MLHVIAAAALAQTWSYGYYGSDSTCTTVGNSITLDGRTGEAATGLAIGQCITSQYDTLEWSMKLTSCNTDANGAPAMRPSHPRQAIVVVEVPRQCCAHRVPFGLNRGRPLHRRHRVRPRQLRGGWRRARGCDLHKR
jgi:hypothetical protein